MCVVHFSFSGPFHMLIFSILKEIFFFLPEKTAVGQWWHENEKKCNYKNKYFSIYLVKKSTLFLKKNLPLDEHSCFPPKNIEKSCQLKLLVANILRKYVC